MMSIRFVGRDLGMLTGQFLLYVLEIFVSPAIRGNQGTGLGITCVSGEFANFVSFNSLPYRYSTMEAFLSCEFCKRVQAEGQEVGVDIPAFDERHPIAAELAEF